MDTDIDGGKSGPGRVFMTMMRVAWGPLAWPLIIANTIVFAWCVYQALV